MNTSRLINVLAILAVTSLVAGCKLEVVAVQGGHVEWSGGSCSEGSNCVVEITDPNFSESFTVTPKPGYQFVKWQKGAGFLCGDSTSLTCVFTMPADENAAAAIIATFATGYIMPVYKDVGIDTDGDGIRNELDEDDDNDGTEDSLDDCLLDPVPSCSSILASEIVVVDGKEWAQVELFASLAWNDINAVCPGGVCLDGGMLNGHDMTGWTWASVDEVNALFNHYIGYPALGPGPDQFYGAASTWAPRFFMRGWRSFSASYWQDIQGFTRDTVSTCHQSVDYSCTPVYKMTDFLPATEADTAGRNDNISITSRNLSVGGWFYRVP